LFWSRLVGLIIFLVVWNESTNEVCETENWCRYVQALSGLNVTQWNLWMEGQRIMMQSYWRLVTKAMCPIGLRCDTWHLPVLLLVLNTTWWIFQWPKNSKIKQLIHLNGCKLCRKKICSLRKMGTPWCHFQMGGKVKMVSMLWGLPKRDYLVHPWTQRE